VDRPSFGFSPIWSSAPGYGSSHLDDFLREPIEFLLPANTKGKGYTRSAHYCDFLDLFLKKAKQGPLVNEKQQLKELLLTKSYRQGNFTLSSGKRSDFYIDGKQTTLSAEGAYLCGKLLFDLIRQHPEAIDAVGGMTLGADPLVTAVSLVSYLEKSPIPAFIVRKESKKHGTEDYLEGRGNLPTGATVALVEDVVTTGGTLLKVIDRVQAQGYRVGLVATIVDRQEGGAETLAQRGFPLQAIFTREELLR
jgi:orotate phosphoribosyltransferase